MNVGRYDPVCTAKKKPARTTLQGPNTAALFKLTVCGQTPLCVDCLSYSRLLYITKLRFSNITGSQHLRDLTGTRSLVGVSTFIQQGAGP